MRRQLVLVCIGCAAGAAQSPAQSAADLLCLEDGGRRLVRELEASLGTDPSGWRAAWRRARDVGPPLAATLLAEARRDGNAKRRLLWLGACAAAAGAKAPDYLLDEAWLRSAKRQEVLMALLACLALPTKGGDETARRLVREGPGDAVRLAALLTLARHATGADLAIEWWNQSRRDDPGLVAAALLAHARVPAEVTERWLSSKDSAASLVQRAVLLGVEAPVRGVGSALMQRALTATGDSDRMLRLAAVASCATSGAEVVLSNGSLTEDLIAVLAATPGGRAQAWVKGWLPPAPSARFELPLRRVLAVAHALAVPVASLDANAWRQTPELHDALCLGFAWRAAAAPLGLTAGPWLAALESAPARVWLRVAFELPVRGLSGGGNPVLLLASQGRIGGRDLAVAIERELWSQNLHPGRGLYAVHMGLVRDLLLSGSDWAKARGARQRAFPYVPAELSADDAHWFGPACEFFDWVVEETDLLDQYRLH